MTHLKSAKQVRDGEHIYGQLPSRLTPREAATVAVVVILILIFTWVMI